MQSKTQFGSRNGRCSLTRGSVAVELALVVPVILLIVVGVVSFGRVINQFAWLSQNAFQAYLLGAEYFELSEKVGPMKRRSSDLGDWVGDMSPSASHLQWQMWDLTLQPLSEVSQDLTTRTLTTRSSGLLPTILGPVQSFPLSIRITGPLLARDASTAGNLGTFANPAVELNCAGQPGSSSSTSCLTGCTATSCSCLPNTVCTSYP